MTRFLISALFAFTCALSANAADTKTKASISDLGLTESTNEAPLGWIPFAALGVSATEFDSALTDRDGIGGNVRLIGSYYAKSNPLVFDTGLGFDTADFNGKTVNSALVELAGRYRFTNSRKWHAGPIANFHLGDEVGTNHGAAETDLATFAGAQLIRDFAVGERGILRAGLKVMTDVGIPDAMVNKFLLEVQMGMTGQPTTVSESYVEKFEEPVAKKEIVEEKVEETKELPLVAETKTIPVSEVVILKTAAKTDALISLKSPKSVFFAVGAKTIKAQSQKDLQGLISFLKANRKDIKSVRVTGFADKTGSKNLNTLLSQSRARFVKNELAAAGLQDIAVEQIVGGEDNDDNLSNARRADIEVVGNSDAMWTKEIENL